MLASVIAALGMTALAADEVEGELISGGKPVTASTKWDAGGVPERLVDGNRGSYWARGQLVLEGKDFAGGKDWFMIDLEKKYVISQVVFYTYQQNKIRGLRLDLSNDPTFTNFVKMDVMNGDSAYLNEAGAPTYISVPFKEPYQYVRVVDTVGQFCILGEVEVFGEEYTGAAQMKQYADVIGTEYEGPVNLLQNLNLMPSDDDDNFGVHQYVTRAQAIDAIVDAFTTVQTPGYGDEIPFKDINEGHPLYNEIYTAYKMGYVMGNGNGEINPDDYISGSEAAAVLLRALGYGPRLAVEKDSTAVSNRIARKLDILYDTSDDKFNALKRGEFAEVLYNALLAPLYSIDSIDGGDITFVDGDNILKEKYGLTLYQDVVFENRVTSLLTDGKEANNIAYVGKKSYTDPSGALDAYIGKNVVIGVYDEEPNAIAFAWPSEDNYEVTIKASDLNTTASEIQAGSITCFDKNNKDKTYDLSDSVNYVYNDIAYPDAKAEDVLINKGEIKLIDNNGDDVFDIVYINSYEMYKVEGYSAGEDEVHLTGVCDKEVVDEAGNVSVQKVTERHVMATDDLIVYNAAGVRKAPNAVKKGNIIALYASPYGNRYIIRVFAKSKVGVLEQLDDDFIYVDSEAIRKATGFNLPSNIGLGDEIEVFTNTDGEVIYVKKSDEMTANAWIVGFCSNWANGGGLAEDLKFKVYTENGEFVLLKPANRLTLDGTRITIDDFNKYMEKSTYIDPETGKNYVDQNFWRFKLNADGNITSIDTLLYNEETENEDSFNMGGTIGVDNRYTSAGSAFYYHNKFITLARNDSPSFTIPTVNDEYTRSDEYDKYYKVGKLTSIVSDKASAMTEEIDYYMVDEYGFPQYFVLRRNFAAGSLDVCGEGSPYMLVTKLGRSADKDGFIQLNVTGIDLSTKKETTIVLETDASMVELGAAYQDGKSWFGYGNALTLSKITETAGYEDYVSPVTDIGYGDILRFKTAEDKNIVERLFDYDEEGLPVMKKESWFDATGGYTGFQFAGNRFQYANVTDYTIGSLDLKITYGTGTPSVNTEKYVAADVSGIAIYVMGDRGFTKMSGDMLLAYKGDNYKVIFYTTAGSPSSAIVYPVPQD